MSTRLHVVKKQIEYSQEVLANSEMSDAIESLLKKETNTFWENHDGDTWQVDKIEFAELVRKLKNKEINEPIVKGFEKGELSNTLQEFLNNADPNAFSIEFAIF